MDTKEIKDLLIKFQEWQLYRKPLNANFAHNTVANKFIEEVLEGKPLCHRYCPSCNKETDQEIELYNPDIPEEGEVWECTVCRENTGFVSENWKYPFSDENTSSNYRR